MRGVGLALLMTGLLGCARMATRPRFDPSTLVTSLDQILAWHRKNAPALAATLSPGLSRAEIEEFARKRNIVLPEEVYVVYGWRNGMRERMPFFDIYQLLPLPAPSGCPFRGCAVRPGRQ
jgi:hypothetical protein